jgi:hypothetical protein
VGRGYGEAEADAGGAAAAAAAIEREREIIFNAGCHLPVGARNQANPDYRAGRAKQPV